MFFSCNNVFSPQDGRCKNGEGADGCSAFDKKRTLMHGGFTNELLACPLNFLHQTQPNKNVSFYFYAPFHLFHFSLSTIATQTTHLSLYAREGVAAILKDFSFCVLKSLDVLIDILFFSFQTKRNFLKIDKLRVQRLRPIEIEFRGIDNPSRSPVEAHLKIELRLNFE